MRGAALAVLVFAVAAAALAWLALDSQAQQNRGEALLRARSAAANLDRYTESVFRTLEAIAAAPPVPSGDLAAMKSYFDALDPQALGFEAGVAWIDQQGIQRARSGDYAGAPIDFSGRAHVRAALTGAQPGVSAGLVGTVNKAPIVAFVVPAETAAGLPNGLVAGGIRLDSIGTITSLIGLGGDSDIVVVDGNDQVIIAPGAVTTLAPPAAEFPLATLRARVQGGLELKTGPMGDRDRLVGFATTARGGWLVLVDGSRAALLGPAQVWFRIRLLVIALAALAAISALFLAARRMDEAVQEQTIAYANAQEAREQLQDAVFQLERRAALRDAFVGVISHELRTPVTTIYGAANLLARSPRRPELESLVNDIEAEAGRLQQITEDLLVLVRAEHGMVLIDAEPVLLQRVVPGVAADIAERYPDAVIRLEIDQDTPPTMADAGSLRQILGNLLTNAIKYGEGSPILIRVARSNGEVKVHVVDEGPGLPADDHGRVFELFYRSPHNAARASGTGIGLFVVDQLTRAMGGVARCRSVEPHGLECSITLPAIEHAQVFADEELDVGVG